MFKLGGLFLAATCLISLNAYGDCTSVTKVYQAGNHATPVAAEFPAQLFSQPQMDFNSTVGDKYVFHTFSNLLQTPLCKPTSGFLKLIAVRGLNSLVSNDAMATYDDGQMIRSIYGSEIGGWPATPNITGPASIVTLNLDSTELYSVVDGKFSFSIQDDTSISTAELSVTYCCDESCSGDAYPAYVAQPILSEFSANEQNQPQMQFNSTVNNRHLKHTFTNIYTHPLCHVTDANIVLRGVQKMSGSQNDAYATFENGTLLNWAYLSSLPNFEVDGNIQLNQLDFDSMADGDFSFRIQDDTTAKNATLFVEKCCQYGWVPSLEPDTGITE